MGRRQLHGLRWPRFRLQRRNRSRPRRNPRPWRRAAAALPTTVTSAADERALAQSVLRLLPQRESQVRKRPARGCRPQVDARQPRHRKAPRSRRHLGAGGPQVARRHDASGGSAAAGAAHLQVDDLLARERAGSHLDALHAASRTAPPQSNRVRQRHPRRARPRHRPEQVPAERRFDARFRQYRGRPGNLFDAGRSLRVGRGKDQPAGGGRAGDADAGGLSHAGRHLAGLPHRRAAVWHPRRDARVRTCFRPTANTR